MPISKKVIFFTGLDRCGKTSTRKLFAKMTGERHVTFDRSFLDNLVYDEVYRYTQYFSEDVKRFFAPFTQLGDATWIVYICVAYDEINRRAKETENTEYAICDLRQMEASFNKYLAIAEDLGIHCLFVTGTGKTVEEIVDETIKKVIL